MTNYSLFPSHCEHVGRGNLFAYPVIARAIARSNLSATLSFSLGSDAPA